MQKVSSLLLTFALSLSNLAFGEAGGSAEIINKRMKVQFRVQSEQSHGSFALRAILEKHGFKNNNGYVKTGEALAPLEIYNYLYEDGTYVFTIFLPFDDTAYVLFYDKGFLAFSGQAAKKLFDLVKLYLPRTDINNLEQYRWNDSNGYCDKTLEEPSAYRCWIGQ